jgi:hypothetical protein
MKPFLQLKIPASKIKLQNSKKIHPKNPKHSKS